MGNIRYVDVISLYPYICKYGKFPVGHTKVYVGADCPPYCLDRKGVIKCKVLPPRELSPSSSTQKQLQTDVPLVFSLCRHYEPGRLHTDERCIVGTWGVDEVPKAVEVGYRLEDVYEFWEYEVTCFDKDTNSGGLFAEYVNMFLKLKLESSGYPSWVQSEEKEKYIGTTGAQRELL